MIKILFLFLNFLIHFLLSLITRSNRASPVMITSSFLKPYSFTIRFFSLSEETINLSATFLFSSFSYKFSTFFVLMIPWRKNIRFFFYNKQYFICKFINFLIVDFPYYLNNKYCTFFYIYSLNT